MDKILNVAVILMYILEIKYNVMLVHFNENRHKLLLEDVSYSEDLLWSVNVGQSLPLAIPLSNSKIPYRQM